MCPQVEAALRERVREVERLNKAVAAARGSEHEAEALRAQVRLKQLTLGKLSQLAMFGYGEGRWKMLGCTFVLQTYSPVACYIVRRTRTVSHVTQTT